MSILSAKPLETELARARLDLAGQKARRDDLTHQIDQYQAVLARLDQATARTADLERQLKTTADNYQLYAKKQEEARIGDELDQKKITNVAARRKTDSAKDSGVAQPQANPGVGSVSRVVCQPHYRFHRRTTA
jgi:uncharacterized protein YPO0396